MSRLSFTTSIGRWAYARGGIIAAGFIALFAGCEPDVPVIDPESNCEVEGNAVYTATGFSIEHYHPSHCPIWYTGPVWITGGQHTYYEASEHVGLNKGVAENAPVFLDLQQADGMRWPTQHPLERWSDHLRASIAGMYLSGTVEPPCSGCEKLDAAFHRVIVSGTFASAKIELPYRAEFEVAIGGPGSVGQGQYFTLSASVNELARQPVTYQWFVGGQSAGPASQSASSFSDYGTHIGENQTYQVRVIDAAGGLVWSDPSTFMSRGAEAPVVSRG